MQSRKRSLQETVTGTSLGFFGSLAITYTVLAVAELLVKTYPALAGYEKSMVAWSTVILCTIWSLARGYHVRRWFAKHDGLHYRAEIDARSADSPSTLVALHRVMERPHERKPEL